MYKYFTGDWWADNLIMTEFLDDVEFYSGSERVKMYKMPKGHDGGSMLYGTTWKSYLSPTKNREKDLETGMSKTKVYSEYPGLKDIFKEYSSIWFPYFEWTQVQLNKNFRTPPHKDSKNIGNSIIVGFGDYTGGNLVVEKEKDIEVKINLAPFKFNGSQFTHYTKDWIGTRYSLVFFNNFKKNNN
tara:strand:+ start:574 stop:1128 length:555 start_codon:yes stop_codon:yes gene_type:complete